MQYHSLRTQILKKHLIGGKQSDRCLERELDGVNAETDGST
jgi:hypothetical protein